MCRRRALAQQTSRPTVNNKHITQGGRHVHRIEVNPRCWQRRFCPYAGATTTPNFLGGGSQTRSGEVIKDFSISYVTHGTLNEKNNAILMISSIAGNHHRIDFLIGPGKALPNTEVVRGRGQGSPWARCTPGRPD